jgi:peroxiredoxin Q/BCP
MIILFGLLMISVLLATDEKPVDLKVGDLAPTFEAKDDLGKDWKSRSTLDKQYLVVYFYPAAMTGGCTKQACSYRDNMEDFKLLEVKVVGISGDPVSNLKIFKKAHNLNFTLLADEKGEIAKKFGVPVKAGGSMVQMIDNQEITMTRELTTARWTFVIDKKGKIIYKNNSVNVEKDTREVLDVIKKEIDQTK